MKKMIAILSLVAISSSAFANDLGSCRQVTVVAKSNDMQKEELIRFLELATNTQQYNFTLVKVLGGVAIIDLSRRSPSEYDQAAARDISFMTKISGVTASGSNCGQ